MHRPLFSSARRAVGRSSLTLQRGHAAVPALPVLTPQRSVAPSSVASNSVGAIATARRSFAGSARRGFRLVSSAPTATAAARLSAALSASLPSSRSAPLQLHGTPLSHFTRRLRILLSEVGVPFDFVRSPSVLATSPMAYADNPLMRVPSLTHGDVCIIDSEHIARYIASIVLAEQQDERAESALEPSIGGRQSGQLDSTETETAHLSSSRRFLCQSVLSTSPSLINSVAVMVGVMSDEVTLLLAKRGGMTDEQLAASVYFQKRAAAINNSLQWIEQQLASSVAAAGKAQIRQADPPNPQLSSGAEHAWPYPLSPSDPLLWPDVTLVCMWQHLVFSPVPLMATLDRYPRIAERVAIIAQRDSVASAGLERSLADAKAAGWVPG